ncbi:primosomal protein N' [Candidatus Babeliales bacterium]|nr:primosomal protein N' [Candidatus Babeliales bacterium]
MYITVRLLNGFKKPLTYRVPESYADTVGVGSLVSVPLRTQKVSALVTHIHTILNVMPTYTIQPIVGLERLPNDQHYQTFLQRLAYLYHTEPMHFIKRLQSFISLKPNTDESLKSIACETHIPFTLTTEQASCVEAIRPALITPHFMPTVLHGVTGSGKTACYCELIKTAHNQNKTSLFLLPEVSLAVSFVQRLQTVLPHIPIMSFHSAVSTKEKRLLWQMLLDGAPIVIVGVHLPILLPIENLGLIIVDEEHEVGFQEKKHPKINSKEAALVRAAHTNIPIILGSATPSITSLSNIKHKKWHYFQLTKRFAGTFPKITFASLKDKKLRHHFWVTSPLHNAIHKRLANREQTIIFLNRRGYSFFMQCKSCSFIFSCNNCSVSLTVHAEGRLTCHYCNSSRPVPTQCPSCKNTEFLSKGIGTQQVVTVLQTFFPHARIERADLDTTSHKKRWNDTVNRMLNNKLDILVGTQTITKGYHFPNVTLVGILWADSNLHFPLFNASETALQQLIQVAGRAGRSELQSEVIVQTMDDHPVLQFVDESKYLDFYERELSHRQLLGYPPCQRLVELEVKHSKEQIVDRDTHTLVERLKEQAQKDKALITILGPSKPPLHRIKKIYIRKIYIKGKRFHDIHACYSHLNLYDLDSTVHFTLNPVTL